MPNNLLDLNLKVDRETWLRLHQENPSTVPPPPPVPLEPPTGVVGGLVFKGSPRNQRKLCLSVRDRYVDLGPKELITLARAFVVGGLAIHGEAVEVRHENDVRPHINTYGSAQYAVTYLTGILARLPEDPA